MNNQAAAPKTDADNLELLKKAMDTGRVALADIAGSKDLRTVADLRDRARVAYKEIIKLCKAAGIP